MKEEGLERGGDGPAPYQASATSFGSGFKVYVMCEIPANVLRAGEFLDIFDGFSIGSNDLETSLLSVLTATLVLWLTYQMKMIRLLKL